MSGQEDEISDPMQEDEEYDLQMALALSMQDYGPQDGSQQPAAAPAPAAAAPAQAPAPPAPHAAPATGSGGGGANPADLAAILAAALQSVTGGQQGPPGAPPAAAPAPASAQQQQQAQAMAALQQALQAAAQPQQPQQQQHHQAQRQQQRQAPAAAAAARPAPLTVPPWAQELTHWWQLDSSGSAGSSGGGSSGGEAPWQQQRQLLAAKEVHVPLAEVPAMLAALSSMLAAPVVCPAAESAGSGGGGAAAGGQRPAGALWLTCLPSRGSGEVLLRASDLDSLIAMWLPRASAGARGSGQLTLLAQAAGRTPPPAQQPAGEAARQVLVLLGLRLGAKAVELMETDEDDLFFEHGQSRTEFIDALRSGSSALGQPGFLSLMLSSVDSSGAAACWEKLLADALKSFAGYKLSGGVVELEPFMLCLDRITQDPRLLMLLAHALVSEVPRFLAAGASRTPPSSILTPLLAISSAADAAVILRALSLNAFFSSSGGSSAGSSGGSSVVTAAAAGMSPATGLFSQLRSYPRNAGEVDGARKVLWGVLGRVADAVHQVLKRLAGMKAPGVSPSSGREVLLSWLGAFAACNEVRCKGGEYGALRHLGGTPDGPMLTLTAAVLRLTEPFVSGYLTQKPKFQDLLTRHLNPAYYTTHAARLGSASTEPSLSGQRGVAGGSSSGSGGGGGMLAADPAAAAGQASFITEVYFVAQRYMRVGLMPAVHRYLKMWGYLHDLLRDAAREEEGGSSSGQRVTPPEVSLFNDVTISQLLQPDMTAHAVQFAVLEIVWLADLLRQQQQPPPGGSSGGSSVFSHIPESVLSDAASWLTFVIQMREAEQLAAVDIGLLMRCLVNLLEHPDQVRSLLVVSKVIHLLLAMLAPQVHLQQRTKGALGRTYMSPGESALVASVLGTSAAQQQLVPALMRVYGQADFVVGLDVDKDDYDKFSMRHEIDLLLLELWQDPRCRACIQAQAQASAAAAAGGDGGGLFAGFVSAVLNDLMYLFKDSLERLADIKTIEDSKKDTKAWSSLSADEVRDKETFYGSQQRTASGFMRYAKTTLDLLLTLTGDRDIGRAFMVQPLLGRTAYASLHFLELLVGPRCQQLDVDKPERYNFDKHALLLTLVQMTGQLAQHTAFPQALAEEPDYEDSLLQSAVALLNAQHAYAAADTLSSVLASVANTPGRQAKKQRTQAPAEGGQAAGAAGAAGAAAGGVASGTALDAQVEGLLSRWAGALGAAAASTYEEAESAYSAALEPLSVGVFDAGAPGAYNSQFRALAAQQEGDSSQKLRRLGRELRDLRGKTKLPVGAAAACFVTQDADRPDKVRCIISGPQDTPYEGGLFVFDVFFPEGYPNVPPLMVLETTGEGRARFNPNLYADGKVCLSLLGTWHGGDEASKWNPSSSSLFQILLSIQGMIFVEDPYFNEPSVDLMRGTSEGATTSMRYNSEVRLSTLRWAVLALLRKPPPGLEEVVRAHFRVLRGVLVARAGRWLREAAAVDPSCTTFNRMVDVMDQIVEAAAAL